MTLITEAIIAKDLLGNRTSEDHGLETRDCHPRSRRLGISEEKAQFAGELRAPDSRDLPAVRHRQRTDFIALLHRHSGFSPKRLSSYLYAQRARHGDVQDLGFWRWY